MQCVKGGIANDRRTQMGAEVHPHGFQDSGGLRRRVHRAGVRQVDGVVVMNAMEIFLQVLWFMFCGAAGSAIVLLFWPKDK